MTHKEEVKLNRFLAKCDAMRDIALCILGDKGHWEDGTGKKKLVYQVDKAEISDTTVVLDESYNHKFSIKIGGEWKKPMELTDRDLEEIIEAKLKLVKEKKAKEEAKKAAAIQAQSNVSYLDVFNRVSKFLNANGYKLSVAKDENSPATMKVGTVVLKWNNIKDFVSAGFGVHGNWDNEGYISIFNVISYWSHKYYKLCYPSLRKLVDKVGVLGEVPEKAKFPFQIMDELDKLKI